MEITNQERSINFADISHTTNYKDNDKPAETYVDTNYKHYNTTIRRTENGLQLRTTNSSPKIKNHHYQKENINRNR